MASTAPKVFSTASVSSSAVLRAVCASAWPASTSISETSRRARRPGQGGAQVVGDGVTGRDAMEPINRSTRSSMAFRPHGQLVVFVAHAAHRHARMKIAGRHRGHGAVKPGQGAADVAADEQAAGEAEQDHQHRGPVDRAHHADDRGAGPLRRPAPTNRSWPVARPHLTAIALRLHGRAVGVGVGDAEAALGGRARGIFQRVGGEVAGDRLRLGVHQQVEIRPVADGPLDHRLVQAP